MIFINLYGETECPHDLLNVLKLLILFSVSNINNIYNNTLIYYQSGVLSLPTTTAVHQLKTINKTST